MNRESDLRRLPVRLRAAFAASCAERMVPAYEDYCERIGIEPVLVQRLSLVWAISLGESCMGQSDLRALFEEDARSRVPKEERGAEYAQDAAIAILYALQALAPRDAEDVSGPVYAARHVTDALDRHLARAANVQPDDPSYEARVTNHPMFLQEIWRQKRDLDDLLQNAHAGADVTSAVRELRQRAVRERIDFGPH